MRRLAQNLPARWVLVEVLLSSSYNGWGTSSLKKDVRELERCVGYLKGVVLGGRGVVGVGGGADGGGRGGDVTAEMQNNKEKTGKIVLMGHSTGCQDVMEYLVGEKKEEQLDEGKGDGSATMRASQGQKPKPKPRPRDVDGAILQAPVSDREGLVRDLAPAVYESSVRMAKEWVDQGCGNDTLPVSATGGIYGSATPISAYRWLSLASPGKDGDDDYFSSDLSDGQLRRTFGRLPRAERDGGDDNDDDDGAGSCPVLILYSGEDEHVPDFVDKEALVERWMGVMKENAVVVDEENGGVLPGAHHSFKQDSEEILGDMIGRVRRFLERIDDGGSRKI